MADMAMKMQGRRIEWRKLEKVGKIRSSPLLKELFRRGCSM